MSKSTAKQLGEHIAEMATGDRSRLVHRIQEVIIEDRKACGAVRDAQIAALRAALAAVRDGRAKFGQIDAALEMSGGVL